MPPNKFYITTTLPYVNAPPHIGFALELVQADIIARYRRLMGDEVFFNTGTDEHGLKIYRQAVEAGKDPQAYADEYAAKFERLRTALNVDWTVFIRTTDPHHIAAAQEFWRRCDKGGDIYKQAYRVKYCVGCELEKTDSELVDSRCPIHPNRAIEELEEENYFFRFSKYQQPLLDYYAAHPDFVLPDFRLSEIRNFVAAGLRDFSISRLKSKMPWGVPVPGDDAHVMYVWFDALINYISTLGWPEDQQKFDDFWGTRGHENAIQLAGKDNLRQQSAMWQAMLMSAGLPNSEHILIHGFITSGEEKMSKSVGNVVDPFGVVEQYGTDALRFWFAHEMPTFGDGDFTWERFRTSYNAHLANGLGNLVSRVMKMASANGISIDSEYLRVAENEQFRFGLANNYRKDFEDFNLQSAIDKVWDIVRYDDLFIQKEEPFKKIKTNPKEAQQNIQFLLSDLYIIGKLLRPFLPETSKKIFDAVSSSKEITTPLFPRLPA